MEIEINSTYSVDVTKGQSITVVRNDRNSTRTFKIGDMAEYDSWNLSYYGKIVSITDKTVTIEEKHFDTKKRRLKLDHFAWRNWNFDLNKTIADNHDTMMYI